MGNWRFIREPVDGIHVTCVIPAKKNATIKHIFLGNAFLVNRARIINSSSPSLLTRVWCSGTGALAHIARIIGRLRDL
jgi:hypothetical protein